jgi:hypothetical protein
MGIDIRATVTCSLGPLISASLNDDYIQGAGLIKTRGSCEIKGIVTPAVGETVTFRYTKSGITRRIPKVLRVLSSFADPFRRITTVELGCKLTYLEDLSAPIKWKDFNDPLYQLITSSLTPTYRSVYAELPAPISAASAMQECLNELGIQASSVPLQNRFTVDEFDFSPGYVTVLSDLLVSESFCGYLDEKEMLQVFSLDAPGGSGPVITQGKIIDVAPIGVGQLPADTVVVRYTVLRLQPKQGQNVANLSDDPPADPEDLPEPYVPDPQRPESPWGPDYVTVVNTSFTVIAYTDNLGDTQFKEYTTLETTTETANYEIIRILGPDDAISERNVVTSREIINEKSASLLIGSYFAQALSLEEDPQDVGDFIVGSITTETFTYDTAGNIVFSVVTKKGDAVYILGSLGINFTYDEELISLPEAEVPLEKIITTYERLGDTVHTVTETYGHWVKTVTGQQAIAASGENIFNAEDAIEFVNEVLVKTGFYLLNVRVDTRKTGFRGEEAPSAEELKIDKLVTNPDDLQEQLAVVDTPGNLKGPRRRVETAQAVLVTGSKEARARIEFTMPYASDDVITASISSTTSNFIFASVLNSTAEQQARKFGVVQNRILLGNRSGMNIQAAPEDIPNKPFAPFFVQAAGVTSLYRTNGTAWTISSDGIVVSTDALAWGVAGKNS